MTLPSNHFINDLLQRIGRKLEISKTQFESAEKKYNAVGEWLRDDPGIIGRGDPHIYPQGSMLIGTTNKPVKQNEHDLDMVCELSFSANQINPMTLLNALEDRIKANGLYSDKYERKNRCIRINYENEFHMDIMPACIKPERTDESVDVPDRELKDWKVSNPKGFAEWFESRSSLTFKLFKKEMEDIPRPEFYKPPLKRVVQLLKRWRDLAFKEGRGPVSIVITTMAGHFYRGKPTTIESFLDVLDAVDQAIQKTNRPLCIVNPTNEEEIFSEKWIKEPDIYAEFKVKFAFLCSDIRKLYHAKTQIEACKILERLFGEDLTREVIKETAQSTVGKRDNNTLAVNAKTGGLTSVGAAAVAVQPNVFYGD